MAQIGRYTASVPLDTDRGGMPQPRLSNAMAQAVGGIGASISVIAQHAQRRQDEKDDFTARIKEQEFGTSLATLESDAVENAAVDGSGIHDSVIGTSRGGMSTPGTFDTKFDQYLAAMPPSRRSEFAAKRDLYKAQTSQRMAEAQLKSEQAYYRVEIEKTQIGLINSLAQTDPGDAAGFEAFKRSGLEIIQKSRLPALEKDVASVNWEAKASDALFQLKLSKDPSFAAQARDALGLGEPPAPLPDLPADKVERQSSALGFFTRAGFTKEQAAGIVGNLIAESNLNTGARNPGDGTDGTDSIGIGQWNSGRARALKAFAIDRRADWQDFETQLAFVAHELRTTESAAGARLLRARTVEEATAAFAGYERPQGWSAANPRGAHNFRGRLQHAQRAAGLEPTGTPPDHRFDAIPLERKLQLANNADVQVRQIVQADAAQIKADYAAYKDALDLRIATGEISDPAVIVADPTLDDGDKATFVRAVGKQNETEAQIGADLSALRDGSLRLDAYSTEDRKRVDQMFDAAIEKVPSEQQLPFIRETIQQTGIVPQPVVNRTRERLASTSVDDVMIGARSAAIISGIDRNALSIRDGGNEVLKSGDLFEHYQNIGLSPEDAARRLIDLKDPAKARERAALMDSKPVKDWVVSTATEATVRDIFDPGAFGFDPALGETPAQAAAMVAEYKDVLQESLFDAGGDQDAAKSLADTRFASRYGTSEFTLTGQGIVTRLPPEIAYPAGADGTHAYIRAQATEALAGEGVTAAAIFLQADTQTDSDVRSGRPARYQIFYRDDAGLLQRYRLPFYALPPSAGEVRQQRLDEGRVRMEQNRDSLLAGRDRGAALDAYLNGPVLPPSSRPPAPAAAPPITEGLPGVRSVEDDLDAQRSSLDLQRQDLIQRSPKQGAN